ncbi:MAG: hypothetical protein ACOVNY_07770 [Chitinophagaceae bacterium]
MNFTTNQTIKRFLLISLIVSYVFAGLNHFINPNFYYPLFPSYLQHWHVALNTLAGFAEIILGIMMIFKAYRKVGSFLIVAMLIAFLPVHMYFIQMKSCLPYSTICLPEWVGWVRLLIIHPILILWAYFSGNIR